MSFQLPSGFNRTVREARQTLKDINSKPRQQSADTAGSAPDDTASLGVGGMAKEIEQLKQLLTTLPDGPEKDNLAMQIAMLEQTTMAGNVMNGFNNNPFGSMFGGMNGMGGSPFGNLFANPFGSMFGGMGGNPFGNMFSNPFAAMFGNMGGGFSPMLGGFNPMLMLMSLFLQPPLEVRDYPGGQPNPRPDILHTSPGFPEPATVPNEPVDTRLDVEEIAQTLPEGVGWCGTEAPMSCIGDEEFPLEGQGISHDEALKKPYE